MELRKETDDRGIVSLTIATCSDNINQSNKIIEIK